MGAKSGFALKFLQWFIRGIQFCCSAVVLALFSYFLAALHNHNLNIPTWTKAVEGISGGGVLYTIIGLLLLCCLAGHPFTSFIAIFLDVCFIGAFIYVAVANRAGASSCRGTVDTVFGTGDANTQVTSNTDGFTNLPTYREACQMETACLAVAIVAVYVIPTELSFALTRTLTAFSIFFILSILVEFVLVRHRRKEQRFGPSPANTYTSGYGRRNKFMGLFKRRGTATSQDPNALPQHTTPDQVRQSYNTESTAVGNDTFAHNKYGESGYGNEGVNGAHGYPEQGVTGATHPHHGNTQPAGYRYNDGTYNA
jgi:hypothetical protein